MMAQSKLAKPATKPVKKPSDAIANAMIVIDTLGWTKGTLQNSEGAVCLMGAAELGVANHGITRIASAIRRSNAPSMAVIRSKTIKYITAAITKGVARRRKIALAKAEQLAGTKYGLRSITSYNDMIAKDADEIKAVLNAALKSAIANGE